MIYFIQDCETENIKIGFAKEPKNRLSNLQSANSNDLTLLAEMDGDKIKEKEIHKLFSSDLVRGEWFKFSDKLKSFIDENAQSVKTIIKIIKVSDKDLEYFTSRYDWVDEEALKDLKNDLQEGKTKEEIGFLCSYGTLFYALQESIAKENDCIIKKMLMNELIEFANGLKEELSETV